jgi:hypothetical protein
MGPEENNSRFLWGAILFFALVSLLTGLYFYAQRLYPDFFPDSNSVVNTAEGGVYSEETITYSDKDINDAINLLPPELRDQILSERKSNK